MTKENGYQVRQTERQTDSETHEWINPPYTAPSPTPTNLGDEGKERFYVGVLVYGGEGGQERCYPDLFNTGYRGERPVLNHGGVDVQAITPTVPSVYVEGSLNPQL